MLFVPRPCVVPSGGVEIELEAAGVPPVSGLPLSPPRGEPDPRVRPGVRAEHRRGCSALTSLVTRRWPQRRRRLACGCRSGILSREVAICSIGSDHPEGRRGPSGPRSANARHFRAGVPGSFVVCIDIVVTAYLLVTLYPSASFQLPCRRAHAQTHHFRSITAKGERMRARGRMRQWKRIIGRGVTRFRLVQPRSPCPRLGHGHGCARSRTVDILGSAAPAAYEVVMVVADRALEPAGWPAARSAAAFPRRHTRPACRRRPWVDTAPNRPARPPDRVHGVVRVPGHSQHGQPRHRHPASRPQAEAATLPSRIDHCITMTVPTLPIIETVKFS